MAMSELERKLFERAVTALVCALAYDEAIQSKADAATLSELRGHWIGDAEEVVDKAERLGLWGDYDDEDAADDDLDDEGLDDEGEDYRA